MTVRLDVHLNVTWLFSSSIHLPNHYPTASLSIYKSLHYKMPSLTPQQITETLSHYDQLIRQALEDGNVVELLTQQDETLVSQGTEDHTISDAQKPLEIFLQKLQAFNGA